MLRIGGRLLPPFAGEEVAICPSLGPPLWFPICSYLNKKNFLFWTGAFLW